MERRKRRRSTSHGRKGERKDDRRREEEYCKRRKTGREDKEERQENKRLDTDRGRSVRTGLGRMEGREGRSGIERENVSFESGGEEKLVVDEAERKMDKLEGAIRAEEEDVCLIYQDDTDLEGKVHVTLWRHVGFRKETGASEFAISVVENGYVPQLWDNPEK